MRFPTMRFVVKEGRWPQTLWERAWVPGRSRPPGALDRDRGGRPRWPARCRPCPCRAARPQPSGGRPCPGGGGLRAEMAPLRRVDECPSMIASVASAMRLTPGMRDARILDGGRGAGRRQRRGPRERGRGRSIARPHLAYRRRRRRRCGRGPIPSRSCSRVGGAVSLDRMACGPKGKEAVSSLPLSVAHEGMWSLLP